MDARRALPFLLLLICTINAAFTYHNGRGGPNSIRRVRRISEYLVPPSPPPKFQSLGRIPRLANSPSDNKPGYFARFMNSLSWLNPFSHSSASSPPLPPPPPPPLPPQPSYSSKIIEPDPLSSATHNVPSSVYKPPPPPSSAYVNSVYSNFLNKIKNCTPCNKSPWMPMHPPSAPTQEKDVPYILPPPPEGQLSGEYLTNNPNILPAFHDALHSASQEIIRIPDFKQQSVPDGNGNLLVAPLPNPQLYPGALPPLYKEGNFNSQVNSNENWGHLGATSSVNNAPTGNGFPLGPVFGGEHNGQYPDPSGAGVVPPESGYTNPDESNGEHFQSVIRNTIPDDLSSSGTQVSHGHANPTSINQVLESTKDSFNSKNHQTLSPGGPDQSSEVFDLEETYTDRKPDESPYNPPDIVNNFPGSYGASDYDRVPNSKEHPDLSSSASREPSWYPHDTDNPFEKKPVENPIHFEQSPLIDVSNKDESRTQSSSIPSTSNEFSDFESAKDSKTEASGMLSGTRQGVSSTTSYFTDIHEISKPDNIGQDGKKNKKVQVIIPYTSDYTPLPFQPSHNKQTADLDKSNHDNYVVEESKHEFNVVRPPSSTFQPWLTLPIFEGTTRKSVDIKANNSIDVHKLQKNIDNWTIQKYSKSTIASTVSPSRSSNPYLSRSKTIPKEYLTTTEPVNRIVDFDYDNVKTYTLSGFTFNDNELKGSTDQRLEESRAQGIKTETSTESRINASTTLEKKMLQGFPLGISSVNKERVYIVTPQPQTTPRSNLEIRKQKALKKAESNAKESEETSMQMDMKETEKSDKFESIEKAYQVLPQAVNNLAVASTGPESVPLWGIMEHENFASPSDSEYDSNDTEPPMYSRLSTESRAKR